MPTFLKDVLFWLSYLVVVLRFLAATWPVAE